MALKIHNSSRETRYIDAESGVLKDFVKAVNSLKLDQHDYGRYIYQSMCPSIRPAYYKPIGGHYIAPPRTTWLLQNDSSAFVGEDGRRGATKYSSHDRLITIVRRYAEILGNNMVAVELSGGLDSAVVIQLLKHIGANLALIGFQSSRYEFRTERRVQESLISGSSNVVIMENDGCFFSNLEQVPPHPMPALSSLFYYRHRMIANEAKTLGAKYVLSGVGGDSLFVDKVDTKQYPASDRLSGWEFNDLWSQDVVYTPAKVQHYCPYSLRQVGRLLHSLRAGEPADSLKLWARKELQPYLPYELSAFAYKASHDGLYSAAIHRQSTSLLSFMGQVYKRCGLSELAAESIKPVLRNWPLVGQQQQQLLLAKLSFGVWVNSNNLYL